MRFGACDWNDGHQWDPRADTGDCGGEGGLLRDQHRGGCPAAGSRAVLSAIDVMGGGGCAFLLSLVFYKICTKIIHKLYVGLRFKLVRMVCREPRHNRHVVSLLTEHTVVSPKVSRTRKRYVQAPYLSAGFGDCEMGDSRSGKGEMYRKLFSNFKWVFFVKKYKSLKYSFILRIYIANLLKNWGTYPDYGGQ